MQCSSNAIVTQFLSFFHILLRCNVKGNIGMIIKIVNKGDAFHVLRNLKNTQGAVLLLVKGWETYDVHENCPIFMTTQPPVHICLNFFLYQHLERPISNESPPVQMIPYMWTNEIKTKPKPSHVTFKVTTRAIVRFSSQPMQWYH